MLAVFSHHLDNYSYVDVFISHDNRSKNPKKMLEWKYCVVEYFLIANTQKHFRRRYHTLTSVLI